jgi:hypothetical protein
MGLSAVDSPNFFAEHSPGRRAASVPPAQQPHDQQEDNRTDRGIDDFRDEATTQVDAKLGKQPTRDQRAGNADQNVADNAKAGASHDLAGQPACDQTDKQNNEKAFIGYVHELPQLADDFDFRVGGKLTITSRRDDPDPMNFAGITGVIHSERPPSMKAKLWHRLSVTPT